MSSIIELSQSAAQRHLQGLVELLLDSVAHGASVGFLAPITEAEASAYWQEVLQEMSEGQRLWVLEADGPDEGRLLGSVQLNPCGKPNGRHRAEVQKLLVHSSARRRGLALLLMETLEDAARAADRDLLVLDTEAGSVAETMFRHLGWLKAGEIPAFAASPDGRFHATALYYKPL